MERGILGLAPLLQQLDRARALLLEAQPTRLLTIGGDCGVEVAPISYLNQRYDGSITVLWFDAHGDLNTPDSSPSGHFHGMPLRILCGEGEPEFLSRCFSTLRPEQVLLVGGRDFDAAETQFIDRHTLKCIAPAELVAEARNSEASNSLEWERQQRHAQRVYIHLDLDVLDPDAFPYVSYNVPAGLSVELLVQILQTIAQRYAVVGMSVTEYIPEGEAGLEPIQQLLEAGFQWERSRWR